MTQLLESAMARVYASDTQTQDYVASMILQILEDEAKWDASFASSQEELGQMVDEALADLDASDRTNGTRAKGVTKALGAAIDEAISKSRELPAENQDELARCLMDEIEEQLFDALIASRSDALDKMLDELREDERNGLVFPMTFDEE